MQTLPTGRVNATMDKLCGMQQGLEASISRHMAELSHKFVAKLDSACREAEQNAFQAADSHVAPQLALLDHTLKAHIQATRQVDDNFFHDLSELAMKQAADAEGIRDLHKKAEAAVTRAEVLEARLAAEAHTFSQRWELLSQQLAGVKVAFETECGRVNKHEQEIDAFVRSVSDKAAEALRAFSLRADERFREVGKEASELELRLVQCIDSRASDCLAEAAGYSDKVGVGANQQLQDAASSLSSELTDARSALQAALDSSVSALRQEESVGCERVFQAAEEAAQERFAALASEMHAGILAAQEQREQLRTEAKTSLTQAVDAWEASLAGTKEQHTADMQRVWQALSQSDSMRINLRRAFQTECMHSRAAAADVAKTSAHARASTEDRLQAQVEEVRSSCRALQKGLSKEAAELREGLGNNRDLARDLADSLDACEKKCRCLDDVMQGHGQKLDATTADVLQSHIHSHDASMDMWRRSQQETLALGNELSTLRAATTSLANGVVASLRVLGLLDASHLSTAGPSDVREVTMRKMGNAKSEAPGRGGVLRIEDLLQWESMGSSLAFRVEQHWRSFSARPEAAHCSGTVLGTIQRRVQAEELAVARELLRNFPPYAQHSTAHDPRSECARDLVPPPGAPSASRPPARIQNVREAAIANSKECRS